MENKKSMNEAGMGTINNNNNNNELILHADLGNTTMTENFVLLEKRFYLFIRLFSFG